MIEIAIPVAPRPQDRSEENARLIFLQSHLGQVLERLEEAGGEPVNLTLNKVCDASGCDRFLAAPQPRGIPSSTARKVQAWDGRGESGQRRLQRAGDYLVITRETVAGWVAGKEITGIEIVGPGLPVCARESVRVVDTISWDDIRWRRSRGALGVPAWTRLQALRVVLVGAGRNGSLLAEQLVAAGVEQVTLVDPDYVEAATLGEASLCFGKDDIGQPKANILVERLARRSRTTLQAEIRSVLDPGILPVLAGADLVVSAIDNPAARLAVATMAARFLRVHLDVGTGVFSNGQGVEMGCDVRLSIPGEGCVHCLGGIGAPVTEALNAIQRTRSTPAWARTNHPVDNSGRSGSLRSLNSIACGFGMRMMEDFLGGTLTASAWLRLQFAGDGGLALQRVTADTAASWTCPICHLAGWG